MAGLDAYTPFVFYGVLAIIGRFASPIGSRILEQHNEPAESGGRSYGYCATIYNLLIYPLISIVYCSAKLTSLPVATGGAVLILLLVCSALGAVALWWVITPQKLESGSFHRVGIGNWLVLVQLFQIGLCAGVYWYASRAAA